MSSASSFEFPAFRSEEWLDRILKSPYVHPDMLKNADLTPGYMAANPTAALYRAKADETKQQIRRALFRHAIFKIQNVEVAVAGCEEKLRQLVQIQPGKPHNWVDWLGGTAEGQTFFTEELWTVDRCGTHRNYFVRYYKEGGDGFSTRVVPEAWRDRMHMFKYYFS